MAKTIQELELELKDERHKYELLQKKFNDLGLRGKAKLYYSLNKNMSDIADMLDKINFSEINLESKADATMERLKILWASVKILSESLNTLETTTTISGDEKTDTAPRNILDIAEIRK